MIPHPHPNVDSQTPRLPTFESWPVNQLEHHGRPAGEISRESAIEVGSPCRETIGARKDDLRREQGGATSALLICSPTHSRGGFDA